jgi:uncharacterized protein DUF955
MPGLAPFIFIFPAVVFVLALIFGDGQLGIAFAAAVAVAVVHYLVVASHDLLSSGFPRRTADYPAASYLQTDREPAGEALQPTADQSHTVGRSSPDLVNPEPGSKTDAQEENEAARQQVRQLVKQALECPTPQGLFDFLTFATKFRRMAVWNTKMAHIQRPGARVIATEYEWNGVGRHVLPDAVPIIILWPFGPIRFVWELADTGPPIDREKFDDPFAVKGELKKGTIARLEEALLKQKTFKVTIEWRRQGFDLAGTAAAQTLGAFAHQNASANRPTDAPSFRIVINDALRPKEQFVTLAHELGHIFCGHLGGCSTPGRGEDDESGWPGRRSLGRHQKEIEAEAVAYLVASRSGLFTHSAEYLKHHAEHAVPLKINEDLIVRAATRIERLAKIHHGSMAFKAAAGTPDQADAA